MLPSHPLAVFEKIDLHQLSDTDIILLDAKSCIQGQIMEEFQRLGILPRIRSTHEQIFCMLNMVKLGNFVGFLNASDPIMRQYLTDIGLIIRPLDPPVTLAAGFIVNTADTAEAGRGTHQLHPPSGNRGNCQGDSIESRRAARVYDGSGKSTEVALSESRG